MSNLLGFGKIALESSDVAFCLQHVARVCGLAGYPLSDWSMFTSTLLDGTPILFEAELLALQHIDAAHAQLLTGQTSRTGVEQPQPCEPF